MECFIGSVSAEGARRWLPGWKPPGRNEVMIRHCSHLNYAPPILLGIGVCSPLSLYPCLWPLSATKRSFLVFRVASDNIMQLLSMFPMSSVSVGVDLLQEESPTAHCIITSD